jgi:hypothetical protein
MPMDPSYWVEPPIACVRFEPSEGAQCRSPHVVRTNVCDLPLVLDAHGPRAELVVPGAHFDHDLRDPEAFRHFLRAFTGSTPFTLTVRQQVRERTCFSDGSFNPTRTA